MERCPGGGGALLALPMPLPSRSDEPVARLYLNSPDALGLLGSASSVRSTRGRVKTTESSVESCVTAVGENFKFFLSDVSRAVWISFLSNDACDIKIGCVETVKRAFML